jgi:hypothetical protein
MAVDLPFFYNLPIRFKIKTPPPTPPPTPHYVSLKKTE